MQFELGMSLGLVESDQSSENLRGERMWLQRHPEWRHLGILCNGHKVHTSVQKCFSMVPELMQGPSRTLLMAKHQALSQVSMISLKITMIVI